MRSPSVARCSFVLTAGLFASLLILGMGCASSKPKDGYVKLQNPPEPEEEMRAIFVATAWNIDWPSKKDLPIERQIAEIKSIVERAKDMKCNTIILQVRSFGDRMNAENLGNSTLQPWAYALNRGRDPGYDPLAEWIACCHDEGIELHAWINAFRVDNFVGTLPVFPSDDGHHLYLDASDADVQKYLVETVLEDILRVKARHYEPPDDFSGGPRTAAYAMSGDATTQPTDDGDGVDGIIIDQCRIVNPRFAMGNVRPEDPKISPDAKPPTARIKAIAEKAKGFPPGKSLPMLAFIKQAFHKVHTQHHRKFALSPNSNSGPAQTWLKAGYLNYVAPQLYFQRMKPGDPKNHFAARLKDWLDDIPEDKEFKPRVISALATYKVIARSKRWKAKELKDQVDDARDTHGSKAEKVGKGHALFSFSSLKPVLNGGPKDNIGDQLRDQKHNGLRLVPNCTKPPIGDPSKPKVTLDPVAQPYRSASWGRSNKEHVRCWAVWYHAKGKWGEMQVYPPGKTSEHVNADVDGVSVKLIDQYNNQSDFETVSQ